MASLPAPLVTLTRLSQDWKAKVAHRAQEDNEISKSEKKEKADFENEKKAKLSSHKQDFDTELAKLEVDKEAAFEDLRKRNLEQEVALKNEIQKKMTKWQESIAARRAKLETGFTKVEQRREALKELRKKELARERAKEDARLKEESFNLVRAHADLLDGRADLELPQIDQHETPQRSSNRKRRNSDIPSNGPKIAATSQLRPGEPARSSTKRSRLNKRLSSTITAPNFEIRSMLRNIEEHWEDMDSASSIVAKLRKSKTRQKTTFQVKSVHSFGWGPNNKSPTLWKATSNERMENLHLEWETETFQPDFYETESKCPWALNDDVIKSSYSLTDAKIEEIGLHGRTEVEFEDSAELVAFMRYYRGLFRGDSLTDYDRGYYSE